MRKSTVLGIVFLAVFSTLVTVSVGADTTIFVKIDVKPLSCPSSINPNNRGKIPIAIITTPSFDATNVDPTTVLFADAAPVKWAWEDFDGDGDVDLVLKFKTQECTLPDTSGHVPLTGETYGGVPIYGSNWVNIVQKNK